MRWRRPPKPDPELLALFEESGRNIQRASLLLRDMLAGPDRAKLARFQGAAVHPCDRGPEILEQGTTSALLLRCLPRVEIGTDADWRAWAMTMMLLARAREDRRQRVETGEQLRFVVTGLFRDFSDASRPLSRPPSDLGEC